MKPILWKTLLIRLLYFFLFLGCAAYVVVRGYDCFLKYLGKPQSSRISYKFNSRPTFPSISLCPSENFRFKNEVLQNCQLSKDEYFKGKNQKETSYNLFLIISKKY